MLRPDGLATQLVVRQARVSFRMPGRTGRSFRGRSIRAFRPRRQHFLCRNKALPLVRREAKSTLDAIPL